MDKINERLAKVRDYMDITQAEMAKILGIGARSYSRYENGERDISAVTISALAQTDNINFNWLLAGQGSMFGGDSELEKNAYTLTSISDDTDYLVLDRRVYAPFADNDKVKAFKMIDDTMGEYVPKNTWVVIDTNTQKYIGEGVYLIKQDDELKLRYLKKENNQLAIVALKQNFKELEEEENVNIIASELHVLRAIK